MSLTSRGRVFSPSLASPCLAVVFVVAALAVIAACACASSARAAGARGASPLLAGNALNAAAVLSDRADHLLVSDARAFARCVQRRASRARCRSQRAAVQAAGRRLAREQRRLARVARATSGTREARAALARRSPVLSLSGERLVWTRNPRIHTYLLVSKAPGQAPHYTLVHGTSDVPPPVPGTSVDYRVRTAERWSAWSDPQQISYPAPSDPPSSTSGTPSGAPPPSRRETGDPQGAPTISVSGETLTWQRVDGIRTYVLLSRLADGAETYSAVVGTTAIPAPVPGETVRYSVRTAVGGSAWSAEVAISYPTEAGASEPTESPAAPSESGQTETDPNFQPGLVSGTNMNEDLRGAVLLGAKVVRVGFSIAASVAELEPVIAGYASEGIRVQPLAEFYERMPSASEAENLASWARAFGSGGTFWTGRSDGRLAIGAIEFGNETDSGAQYATSAGSPAYTALAEAYATRFREAAVAVQASGAHVGLLAQDDDQTGDWMRGMYAAVPDLTSYVAGWTIHPYGGEQYNRERLAALISQTAERGASTIPIDITEWGVSTDGGDCVSFNEGLNTCMSYEEAAHELDGTVAWIKQLLGARLGDFFLYQVRDQQAAGATSNWQAYFGLLQHELQPKGAYTTAAQALLAS
jgi:hypothetical protein